MSHMILCVWKRDKDRNTSVSRELCYHMKYQIVPPDRVCGACCRGQMYERKRLWDRDWLISPSTQATYFSSTFQWNSDTDMTRISCHFQCQSNSVCVCVCVVSYFHPLFLYVSPSIICLQRHFTITLMCTIPNVRLKGHHVVQRSSSKQGGELFMWGWLNSVSGGGTQTQPPELMLVMYISVNRGYVVASQFSFLCCDSAVFMIQLGLGTQLS